MNNKFNLSKFIRKNKKILVTTTIISLSLSNISTAKAEKMNNNENELVTEADTSSSKEVMHLALPDSLYVVLEPEQLELLSNLLLEENEVNSYLEEALDEQFIHTNKELALKKYNYVLSNTELTQEENELIEYLQILVKNDLSQNNEKEEVLQTGEEPQEELMEEKEVESISIQSEEIPSSDVLYNEAMYTKFATVAWNLALQFKEIYPNDTRVEQVINEAANRQLILGKNNHRNQKFDLAILYYQRILTEEVVDSVIQLQTEVLLNIAMSNEKIKTADELYNEAMYATFATEAWDAAQLFKVIYPYDSRLRGAMNKAADRQLTLGKNNHLKREFYLALEYYERLLYEELIDKEIKSKASNYQGLAVNGLGLQDSDELYSDAINATYASEAWEIAQQLKRQFPDDARVSTVVNKAANRLAILGKNNHQSGNYALALSYYDKILSDELVKPNLFYEIDAYRKQAKNNEKLATADELYHESRYARLASDAWDAAQKLKNIYQEDTRISNAINRAANRLAVLGVNNHRSNEFKLALEYYAKILSEELVDKKLVEDISVYQKQAQNNEKLVTADELYNEAMYASLASDAWDAAQNLKTNFPNDNRIIMSLNRAGNRLLILGKNHHSEGNFDLAIDYYTMILSEGRLNTDLLSQTSIFLEYAENNEVFKTADELYNEARYATFASDAWNAAISLKLQYPSDSRIQGAITHASERIFILGINNHKNEDFNSANSYYERLVGESLTPIGIQIVAEDFLSLSKQGNKLRSASEYRDLSTNAGYASDAWNYALKGLAIAPNNSNLLKALNDAANRIIILGRTNQKSGDNNLAVNYYNRIISESRVSQSLITLATVFKNQIVKNDKPTIVIDPGHGGYESGATFFGVREKLLNLNTSQYLKNELEAMGYHVVMTRNTDTFVDLTPRATQANEELADIFVSVHYNAMGGSGSAHGIETFIHHTLPNAQSFGQETNRDKFKTENVRIKESLNLADNIHGELINDTGFYDRGVKGNNFNVLRNTHVPAVLLELGFMDNRNEFNIITQRDYQKKAAKAVANGIDKYFKGFM